MWRRITRRRIPCAPHQSNAVIVFCALGGSSAGKSAPSNKGLYHQPRNNKRPLSGLLARHHQTASFQFAVSLTTEQFIDNSRILKMTPGMRQTGERRELTNPLNRPSLSVMIMGDREPPLALLCMIIHSENAVDLGWGMVGGNGPGAVRASAGSTS